MKTAQIEFAEPPAHAGALAEGPVRVQSAVRPLPRRLITANGHSLWVTASQTWAQLHEELPGWQAILDENPTLSIFSTPEWLGAWWKAFAANRSMLALSFSKGDGTLAGLIPLYREDSRSALLGTKKTLRLVGDGSEDSDGLDLIFRPGFEKACARAFVQWLAELPGWDICELNTLPETSAGAKAMIGELAGEMWPLSVETASNSSIFLPASWDAYVESLSPAFRPLLTRYPKKLAAQHQIRIHRWEDARDLPQALETLFALHQKRWTNAEQKGSFVSTERRDFYAQMADSFLQRGWLELWILELDGKPVAAQFCFLYRNTACILQEGFDPEFAAQKVGYALRGAMLRDFIRRGVKKYDFLGGVAPHKEKWGAQRGSYLNLRFAAPRSSGSRYLTCQKLAVEGKEWLRHRLPAPAWNALHWLNIKVGVSQ